MWYNKIMENYSVIIVALITAAVPTITTAICTYLQKRINNQHHAKQSILQLILEDQVNYSLNKKLPVNFISIHDEYDDYHKNGGNHYVTAKVKEYDEWFKSIERKSNGSSKKVVKRK